MANNSFNSVLQSLSPFLVNKLKSVPDEIRDNLIEIRLRVNKPIALCLIDDTYYLTDKGCLTNTILNQPMLITNSRELQEIFNTICCFSVYSKQNEIKNGYVTIKGGHRIGICGTAVIENNSIINIRNISSINIRISAEHKDCSKQILSQIKDIKSGLLICGAPCSGKTTILRDLARLLSTDYKKKVALIDQRSEIAATYKGVSQYDVGMCDVLDGYSKNDGFDQGLRCMSPDIIICDEIGTAQDITSLENSVNSGVSVIASAHCTSPKELKSKPQFQGLISSGAFTYAAFLGNKKNVGQLMSVVRTNELHI